jgi:hypothetical protein
MNKIVEHSIISKKNVVVIIVALFVLLTIAAFPIYAWMKGINTPTTELFFELLLVFVLVERVYGKYTYELEKKQLRITKRGLFGTDTYVVNLKELIGIYDYKPKIVGIIKFRRTMRLHSALDGRQVWTIAYKVINKKGKQENWRIYFKPSENMLSQLHELFPRKVMIPEQEAIVAAITEEKEQEQAEANAKRAAQDETVVTNQSPKGE